MGCVSRLDTEVVRHGIHSGNETVNTAAKTSRRRWKEESQIIWETSATPVGQMIRMRIQSPESVRVVTLPYDVAFQLFDQLVHAMSDIIETRKSGAQ